jgi:hypothetical protein
MRQVGTIMARVHEIEARLLASVAERSGAEGDARAAFDAAEQSRRSTADMDSLPEPPGPAPTDDLKKLFREAAKRLHPDLFDRNSDAREHAEAFMKRLNAAYRAGDAQAMVDLLRQWEASPMSTLPDDDAARASRAAREVKALRVAVAEAQERLAAARSSQIAGLMEQVMSAAAAGGDLMAEMRADAVAALTAAQARLAELGPDAVA